jgi:hypothetical protein
MIDLITAHAQAIHAEALAQTPIGATTFTSSADALQFKLDGESRRVTFDTPPASGTPHL